MAEKHPDELVLLSYVEEELDDPARREVAEHLVACPTCAQQICRLQAGRDALRAAPLLELPDDRRAEILSTLPEHPERWRLFQPVKRALVVAAPVAAAAALVGVFVLAGTQLGGGGDNDEAGEVGGGAQEATVRQGTTSTQDTPPLGATLIVRVQGPAAAVVRILENEGLEAEVVSQQVVVADARPREVRAALGGRPSGSVGVYVK
jgi:anti-sigma factor RsiW